MWNFLFKKLKQSRQARKVAKFDKGSRSSYPKLTPPLDEGLFGPPHIDFKKCTGCSRCVSACPTTALSLHPSTGTPEGQYLFLSLSNCIFCERCRIACPEGALEGKPTFEISTRKRAPLEQIGLLPDNAIGESKIPPRPGQDASVGPVVENFQKIPKKFLKKSLKIFPVNTGSCHGCEEELFAAFGPLYDLARLGVTLVNTPQHADVLFVTGPVTRNMLSALQEAYEAVPEPKLVLAAGTCATDGNVFRGAYGTVGPLDRILPVDVYLPGCPPTPHSIMHALLLIMERTETQLQHIEYTAPGLTMQAEDLKAILPQTIKTKKPSLYPEDNVEEVPKSNENNKEVDDDKPSSLQTPEEEKKELSREEISSESKEAIENQGETPSENTEEKIQEKPVETKEQEAQKISPLESSIELLLPSLKTAVTKTTTPADQGKITNDQEKKDDLERTQEEETDVSAPQTTRVKTLPWATPPSLVTKTKEEPSEKESNTTQETQKPGPEKAEFSTGKILRTPVNIPTLSTSKLIPSLSKLSSESKSDEDPQEENDT